jgi:hypothetical protein
MIRDKRFATQVGVAMQAAVTLGRRLGSPSFKMSQGRSARQRLSAGRSGTGMSLLEVLVVITLIGLLLQITLPAVEASREAARRHVCSVHLRQIGIGMQMHHDTYGHLPSGGWHYTWIGEPERATGPEQPGGWIFNLLGFLDEQSLRDAGRHQTGETRMAALTQRCRTVLPLFHCPSRRDARTYPQTWNRLPHTQDTVFAKPLEWVAKTDYAANAGATEMVEFDPQWSGPRSLTEGDAPGFAWPETRSCDGIVFGRSRIRDKHIRDGLGKTYLVGEKYVDRLLYETGEDWGDNENLYTGFNNDHCRSALSSPQPDQAGRDYRNSFGSAHWSVWQAVLCDGSVRAMRFDIDPLLHRQLASRSDGGSRLRVDSPAGRPTSATAERRAAGAAP